MRFDDIITLFPTVDVIEIWQLHLLKEEIVYRATLKKYDDEIESYGYRTVYAIEPKGTTRIKVILNEEK